MAPCLMHQSMQVNGTTYFQRAKFPFVGSTVTSPDAQTYSIVKLLGKGTFGQAFEVVSHQTGRTCAMKVIDLSNERMEREAIKEINNHMALKRSNAYDAPLLQYFEHFVVEDKMCIVMEKLEKTLFDRTNKLTLQLRTDELKAVAYQILKGVARIHSLGFAHTDLKQDNVMYVGQTRPNDVKIIDFGLLLPTRALQHYQNATFMARSYRAPEIFLGLPLNEKVDMWSIGVMLWELYLGRQMFTGNTDCETMHQISSMFSCLPVGVEHAGTFYNKYYSFDPFTGSHYPRIPTNCSHYRSPIVFANLPQYGFNANYLGFVSGDDLTFHNLLGHLLSVEPMYRMSAKTAMRHPFFSGIH